MAALKVVSSVSNDGIEKRLLFEREKGGGGENTLSQIIIENIMSLHVYSHNHFVPFVYHMKHSTLQTLFYQNTHKIQ